MLATLALTQAQGIVIALGGAVFLAVAGAVLLARARRPRDGMEIRLS